VSNHTTVGNQIQGETVLTPSLSPVPTPDSMSHSTPLTPEKLAAEERLRNLVLASRRKGAHSVSGNANHPASRSQIFSEIPIPAPSLTITALSKSDASLVNRCDAPDAQSEAAFSPESLDTLATSFISEALLTSRHSDLDTAASRKALLPSNGSNVKFQLAAKQRMLEQQIAESKRLMSQLAQARSKEQKGKILSLMRESNRCGFFHFYAAERSERCIYFFWR
jgi:hypothetical protein